MNFSDEERSQGLESLQKMTASMTQDKNRIAKAAAAFIRNQIEDFHVRYLSDDQMKSLNPLIRGAIYSFLVDFGDNYTKISSKSNINKCADYILSLTIDFLRKESFPESQIKEFAEVIIDQTAVPLLDLAKGGGMLVGYEWLYVPKYWEDCVYFKIK